MPDFLDSEEAVIADAQALLDAPDGLPDAARPPYADLLREYEKLNKEMRRLIRISDRIEERLGDANNHLAAPRQISKIR